MATGQPDPDNSFRLSFQVILGCGKLNNLKLAITGLKPTKGAGSEKRPDLLGDEPSITARRLAIASTEKLSGAVRPSWAPLS